MLGSTRKFTPVAVLLFLVVGTAILIYSRNSLSFSPSVFEHLTKANGEVVFEGILEPGEKVDLPDFSGATSIGYYVDEKFPSSDGGDFVFLYGSDGSRSGSSFGGEFRPTEGATYWAVNEGRQVRRFLVYIVKDEQDSAEQPAAAL